MRKRVRWKLCQVFCEQKTNLCRVGAINCDFHSIAINQKHQTEQIEMLVVASIQLKQISEKNV